MVNMEGYYFEDCFSTLHNKIDKLHLKYLDIEQSPEKIEIRIELEDLIKQYLGIASHNQKFLLPVTYDVLFKSANMKPDFSIYKAAIAFDAMQLYAANLVSQPWRREYKRIRKFSGFYKHNIESNLFNTDLLLEAMGYKSCGFSTLILDGPVEPDKVISVSRDCLVAFVECQIIKAIWEEVASTNVNVSWLDILDARRSYMCSPEQSAKALKYHYQQKHFNDQIRNFTPSNYSIPPGLPHSQMVPPLLHTSHNIMKPQFNTNGYYYSHGLNMNYPAVPIAQLIEVEPQNGYDVTDRQCHSRNGLKFKNMDNYGYLTEDAIVKENRDSDKTEFEDWDYVYKTLENKGYNKDLGDRGDVLSLDFKNSNNKKKKEKEKERKPKLVNLEIPVNNLTITNKNKQTPKSKKLQEISPASSYDNLTPADKMQKNSTLNFPRTKSQNPEKKISKPNKNEEIGWHCKTCTYLNNEANNICEMCSKSRSNKEEEIEVGGTECENCTLVNPKDARTCQACYESLENSPTRV